MCTMREPSAPRTRTLPCRRTAPIAEHRTPNLSQIAARRAESARDVTSSIRSCDSDTSTSASPIVESRTWTAPMSMSIPTPSESAVSETAHARPPPPRSFIARTIPSDLAARTASITSFSVNGSGICTAERWSSPPPLPSPPPSPSDANPAPPIPSRPVAPPTRCTASPAAAELGTSDSLLPNPTAATSTSAYPLYDSSNPTSPPTVGTPMQLP